MREYGLSLTPDFPRKTVRENPYSRIFYAVTVKILLICFPYCKSLENDENCKKNKKNRKIIETMGNATAN